MFCCVPLDHLMLQKVCLLLHLLVVFFLFPSFEAIRFACPLDQKYHNMQYSSNSLLFKYSSMPCVLRVKYTTIFTISQCGKIATTTVTADQTTIATAATTLYFLFFFISLRSRSSFLQLTVCWNCLSRTCKKLDFCVEVAVANFFFFFVIPCHFLLLRFSVIFCCCCVCLFSMKLSVAFQKHNFLLIIARIFVNFAKAKLNSMVWHFIKTRASVYLLEFKTASKKNNNNICAHMQLYKMFKQTSEITHRNRTRNIVLRIGGGLQQLWHCYVPSLLSCFFFFHYLEVK